MSSLLLAVLIVAVALAYVLWPLFRPPRDTAAAGRSALEHLEPPARDG